VLVLAPTGKAVDEAIRGGAGDSGLTVAKALNLIEGNQLRLDRRTVIVGDEAAMVGTPELRRLLEASTAAHAKMVLVGDAYQLAPVKARGGMFEHLCDDLPWSQRLTEVWRMRDPAERDSSLALRCARGNRLRKAIGWYRTHERLHTGDPIAMAADATNAYLTARAEGKDVAILCDTWEIADAINQRLHDHFTAADAPAVTVARDQQVRPGDLILSRHNDATVTMKPAHTIGEVSRPTKSATATAGASSPSTLNVAGSLPSGSPTRSASSSRATTCASTSLSATPALWPPPKA
jgi:ATP-dependent exoDNAse (exonuclease V) alpha subunit